MEIIISFSNARPSNLQQVSDFKDKIKTMRHQSDKPK
jgi:hypothetical protein